MNAPKHLTILLGLPVLLGCSDLLVKALVVAAMALLMMLLCGLLLAPWRRWLTPAKRLVLLLILAGTLVSCLSLLMQMHSHELFHALELFLPLLVLPCLSLAQDQPRVMFDGLTFAGLALLLGLLREGVGKASLLGNADWLFGSGASSWHLSLADLQGLQLLTLAPGAFILLGLLLALARHFSATANERS